MNCTLNRKPGHRTRGAVTRRWLSLCLAIVVGVASVGLSQPALADHSPDYHFTPVNQHSVKLTAEYWNPILAYVSKKSGINLDLKIGRTSTETTDTLLSGGADFAFTNHLFTPERLKLGWTVFGRRNTPPIRGVLIVPADSPITSLSQLAGERVGFPGPEATVSYKFTYAQLLVQNIDVKVEFGGNTDSVLVQLFSGRVKAAGVNSQLAEAYAQRGNQAFRVLWQSPPVSELALMVSPRVPPAHAKAVADAFLSMGTDPDGKAIIRQVSALVKLPPDAAFVPATLQDYAAYTDFFNNVPMRMR